MADHPEHSEGSLASARSPDKSLKVGLENFINSITSFRTAALQQLANVAEPVLKFP